MSDTAFQRKYRQEFIAGFEKRTSLLRRTVVTETEINGNECTFLVADSGSAEAVTRGVNGDIPTRPDNLNQYTATLKEWHDVPERTRFNIYASQGDGRKIMQMTSMGVMNRKIDSDIRSALAAATNTQTMTLTNKRTFFADLLAIIVTLSENNAIDTVNPDEMEPWFVISPGFHANMQTLDQYTSADYVRNPLFSNIPKSRAFNWNGANFLVDTAVAGVGTSAATCYAYSRNAIGHACDSENIVTKVGYDDKNDKSWCRVSAFMGSKLLQNSGIVKISHDDTTIITTA